VEYGSKKSINNNTMRNISVVLSAGGVKGAFQVGFLDALFDHGYYKNIECISGTSIGAIVGAAACANKMKEAESYFLNHYEFEKNIVKYRNFFNPITYYDIYTKASIANLPLYRIMQNCGFSIHDVTNSPIKFFTCSTNITRGTKHYVYNQTSSAEQMYNGILSSASIPFVFEPVRMFHKDYRSIRCIDGALVEPIPIEIAVKNIQETEHIFVVCTLKEEELSSIEDASSQDYNIVAIAKRIINTVYSNTLRDDIRAFYNRQVNNHITFKNGKGKKLNYHFVFMPEDPYDSPLDFNVIKNKEVLQMGYDAGRDAILKLK